MKSNTFAKLISGLAIAFALPLILLIIIPFAHQSGLMPIQYAEGQEVDGGVTVYPDPTLYRYGSSDFGAQVYAAE